MAANATTPMAEALHRVHGPLLQRSGWYELV